MSENYFDIFELPKKLKIDHNELKKKFFVLSKKLTENKVVSDKIEMVNRAYDTLKERLPRIRYLLELEGQKTKKTVGKAPKSFSKLADEVNAVLPKAQGGNKSARDELKRLHDQIMREFSTVSIRLATLEKQWDEVDPTGKTKDIIAQLKKASEEFHFIQGLENLVRQILT